MTSFSVEQKLRLASALREEQEKNQFSLKKENLFSWENLSKNVLIQKTLVISNLSKMIQEILFGPPFEYVFLLHYSCLWDFYGMIQVR